MSFIPVRSPLANLRKDKKMEIQSSQKLKVTTTAIPEVLIIEPKFFGDSRGWFVESFNAADFALATKLNVTFVQDNHSFSRQWTLRGMHYQLEHTQGKLVRVTVGSVFDVAVDMRKDSTTFGKWVGVELSSENHKQLWIPAGFAHGFLVLKLLIITIRKAKFACRGVTPQSTLIGPFHWVRRLCSMLKIQLV